MESKDEIKKKTKRGKKTGKGEGDKKGKGKKSKKKSSKKSKKSMLTQNPFVQRQEKSNASFSMGQQPFGAGGLGSILSSLGIQPKFQTTGFSIPAVTQPEIIRKQPTEPRMENRVYVEKPVTYEAPSETINREDQIYNRLARTVGKESKEALRDRIYYYFGGNNSQDLDYVIQDEILKYNTKNAMLKKMAEFAALGYGNIDVEQFINFDPLENVTIDESLSVSSGSTVNVVPTSSSLGGETPSELGSVGFGSINGDAIEGETILEEFE